MCDIMRKEIEMVRRLFIIIAVIFIFTSCDGNGEEMIKEKFYFECNGVRFCVGDGADSVTRALGDANRVSRADSCAGIGEDIIYIYNGFRILAYSDGGETRITSIELVSDAVSTPEGVEIGDGTDAVIRAYGVPDKRDGNVIEYESGGVMLRFSFAEGSVRSVKYLVREE